MRAQREHGRVSEPRSQSGLSVALHWRGMRLAILSAMSHTPADLADLLTLLLTDLAEDYGWPRRRVPTAVEAGLPEGTPGVVYLVGDDEGTGR